MAGAVIWGAVRLPSPAKESPMGVALLGIAKVGGPLE